MKSTPQITSESSVLSCGVICGFLTKVNHIILRIVSCFAWVPRGAARARPVRFELSNEEINRIQELAKAEEEIEKEQHTENNDDEENANEIEVSSKPTAVVDEDDTSLPAELKMDEYDDESDVEIDLFDNNDADDDNLEMEIMENGDTALAIESNLLDEDDEDVEDDIIRPTDSVLLLATTEDEESHLEVQILTEDGTLYTHHDIMLPDFPLCMAWMDCPPFVSSDGQQQTIGNYVAVGTFSPAIEIWNLDVMDPVEPSAVLGGEDKNATATASLKKKKNKTVKYLPGSHTDSVLSLSWNNSFRQALASGSADKTVKVWDVTNQTCSYTFSHHTDKVQAVTWHPQEAWLLTSGGFDKAVHLVDCRSAATTCACTLPSDIEQLVWDPFHNYHLYGSLEDGQVICIDVRKCSTGNSNGNTNSALLFAFQAHDKTTSSLAFSSSIPGLLATASLDKTVKIWDLKEVHNGQDKFVQNPAKCIAYKTMNVGKLFSLRFHPNDPYLLAAGGDKGIVAVWESDEMDLIKSHFQEREVTIINPYANLHEEGEEAVNLAKTEMSTIAEQGKLQLDIKPTVPDDSWMEDNDTAAKDKTQKKKKNSKKSK